MQLLQSGCEIRQTTIPSPILARLRETLFQSGKAGTRCLLDEPLVRETASSLREDLIGSGRLAATAIAIQAIAFDKTAETNWKVAWHQDVMFPFARPVSAPGFELPVRKAGIDYARPPLAILERLLAVRLHLDDCGEVNGPLRVIPGSHLGGVFDTSSIPDFLRSAEPRTCLATEGEILLMRPLTLHASSQATEPGHRRVLHFVYDSGEAIAEEWHRSLGPDK